LIDLEKVVVLAQPHRQGNSSQDRESPLGRLAAKWKLSMAPNRITFADLMETARSFPQEVRDLTFTLAITVIRHFFGEQWCEDHIIQDATNSRSDGFMRLNFTPGYEGEKKTSRLRDFAETLFNLQRVEGFDDRVQDMRTAEVEAAFAEFDFARSLYIHDIAFKFVKPSGVKGQDYDFEIEYADGRAACADAKCRVEGTDMRAETVRNSLTKARTNNLPPDKPGVIFVKVPQQWLEDEGVHRGISSVVEGFLRNTERIVSVVIHATYTIELAEQKMILLGHRFHEFLNASHRFDRAKSWALFKDYRVPEEWGGMPPKWKRVFSQGFIMPQPNARASLG
jgi:hypothetical protein